VPGPSLRAAIDAKAISLALGEGLVEGMRLRWSTELPGVELAFTDKFPTATPAVAGRIEEDAVVLDPRTVGPYEDRVLLEAVREALAAGE
jgi:L-seryl-tRNA(Ser) seleniumtransferase